MNGKLTAEQVRELIAPHLKARPTFDFGRHGAVWSADFQAIADELNATLGDAFTREECEASFVHGYSLGTLPVGSDSQWDENRQTVDEHMAELGWVRERTCRNIVADDSRDEFVCSECGYVVGAYEYGPDIGEHCKGCGAKVVG